MPVDIPNIQFGEQTDYRTLFRSDPIKSLQLDVTFVAGYGKLEVGTIVARVRAGTSQGKYVPYNPTDPDSGSDYQQGRAFLLQDASGATLYVTQDDSYKFSVGDIVIIIDSDTKTTSSEDLGAITAIDRTTYTHQATITVTNSVSGTFTVANSACICLKAGADNANSWSDAVAILPLTIDTGTGSSAAGALAPILLKNAIIKSGTLKGYDSAAATDLGLTEIGQFYIM